MHRPDGKRPVSSYSGSNYDVWSYQEAARTGQLHDTPLNKMQHKFWVTKQKVTRKLGHEEDQHIVASDQEIDAKLELFRSIYETTCRLQRLMEIYQDRICFLAGEENALGRFLKDHGKSDKTRAGKMMVAAGKTMSYTGQQRLAIRVPLVRLYQEVDTFRLRAIEDTRWTVENMEKARNEYRGALMWMKNVSTELDPDTFKQLEKFRKVQAHVKSSKLRFDKLKLDCVQKIDLLAASRCNMFSHALIMYQNTLVTFWDKTSKTMNHVNNGFKGYQYYEFSYIKDLAGPSKHLAAVDDDKSKERKPQKSAASFPTKSEQSSTDLVNLADESKPVGRGDVVAGSVAKSGSMHNLLNLDTVETTASSDQVPSLDENDEILLRIDDELGKVHNNELQGLEDIFARNKVDDKSANKEDQWPGPDNKQSELMLDELLANTKEETGGGFTAEWENAFKTESLLPTDEISDLLSENIPREKRKSISNQTFLPSKLFDFNNTSDSNNPSTSGNIYMATNQTKPTGSKSQGDKNEWFSLFADLDPLANPDSIGKNKAQYDGGC